MGALAGEDFAAGLSDKDVVFDADADLAGHVDAGLDGQNLAGLESALRVRLEERGFVDFQAEAGPRAVAVNPQAALFDHLPGGGIDLREFDTGPDRLDRRGLGLLDDVIDPSVKRRHAAEREASSDIAAIAFVSGPEVDQDAIFLFELSSAGLMMRPGGVRAESDDGLEAVARAELADLKIQHAGQFALGETRLDVRQGLPEGSSGDRGGGPNRGQLALVFDATDRLDDIRRCPEPGLNGLFQLLEVGQRGGPFDGHGPHGF